MAQGINEGIVLVFLVSVPKICGKEDANEVAPWIAAKWYFPMLSLEELVGKVRGIEKAVPVAEAEACFCSIQRNTLRHP